MQEELRRVEHRVIEEHMHEELKCTAREEASYDMGHEEKSKYQVSNFFCCCLKLLSDPDAMRKLTHMLTTCMGEEGSTITISAQLPKRDVCEVSKRKCTKREFNMTVEPRSYEMDGVVFYLRSNVSILPRKSWELMDGQNLVWSPIQLWLANQYRIYPIG